MIDGKHTLKEFLDIADHCFENQLDRIERFLAENFKAVQETAKEAMIDCQKTRDEALDLIDKARR